MTASACCAKGDSYDQKRNQLALEYRFRRADGSYIWVRDIYSGMRDDAGQVVAWLGIMVDITASIEAREDITRLASIVEASDDAICSQTLEGIITYWNPAAERLYGYTAEEAVGQSLTMLFPHPGTRRTCRTGTSVRSGIWPRALCGEATAQGWLAGGCRHHALPDPE